MIYRADVLHVNASWKKRKRKEKSALKLIKTDQQVKHCIRIKNLSFVNTNTNHVPKSGYNQIDVARIVFIFVCVRVCVFFATDYHMSLP